MLCLVLIMETELTTVVLSVKSSRKVLEAEAMRHFSVKRHWQCLEKIFSPFVVEKSSSHGNGNH